VATVTHRQRDDGTHEIGVRIGGAFVPFAALSEARVAQLVENAEQRAESETETEPNGKGK
jgi:hypothetical protein